MSEGDSHPSESKEEHHLMGQGGMPDKEEEAVPTRKELHPNRKSSRNTAVKPTSVRQRKEMGTSIVKSHGLGIQRM